MAFLLLKSLRPVKDLEQPVSLSSSTQTGGDNEEEEDGGRVEQTEEGIEEWDEEEPELNSPSLPCTFTNTSPSVSSGAPLDRKSVV